MPVDLSEMLNPRTTAVLTMEVQRNTVGDLTSLPDLRRAVEEAGTLAHIRDLLATARTAGVLVVHCTVGPDFVPGIRANYPGAAAIAKRTAGRAPQPGASDPVTDIGPSPDDVVM